MNTHDTTTKHNPAKCHCRRCRPLERPCGCSGCAAYDATKTKTVKVRVITEYTAKVPEGWTAEQILFQWGCSDSIEIKQAEELPAEITEEAKP